MESVDTPEVLTVNLDELSSIVGVAQDDLVAALQHEDVVSVAGTLADQRTSTSNLIGKSFNGFVVGLDQVIIHPLSQNDQEHASESTNLLSKPASNRYGTTKSRFKNAVKAIGRFKTLAKHRVERRKNTCLEELHPNFTLAIPAVPNQLSQRQASTQRPPRHLSNAYIIPMQAQPGDHHAQYILAVSEAQENLVYNANTSTIMRQLSTLTTLPSELSKVTLETVHDEVSHDVAIQVVVTKRVPLVGYVLLVAALLTISSLGAALDLQNGVDPFVKLFWRTTASILGFIPFAAYSIYEHGWPKWTIKMFMLFVCSSISYALFLMTFLWSLNHTSIGHAYIFNNCHSLLIVIGKLVLGQPVLLFEIIGSGLGIVGGVVTTMDHSATEESASTIISPTWQGDVVALIGAVGGVFYLLTAKKLRQEMDVFLFMTLLFVVTALLHFPVFYALDIDIHWSFDHHVGLFGWLQPDMLGVELYLVFVCTIIGTVGYISVMKYFDPIVVSVVMLLEPILATAMGVVVGVDAIPGLLTWVGGFLVIVGTGLVVLAANNKKEAHDVTEVIHKTPPTAAVFSCKLKKGEKIVVV